MGAHSYQKLEVWQRSVDLTVKIYDLLLKLPRNEQYALSDQIRRSAVSIPSNIAEGQKRFSAKEKVQFTSIALGSVAELETQVIIAGRVYGLDVEQILEECAIISRMVHALIKSLRQM